MKKLLTQLKRIALFYGESTQARQKVDKAHDELLSINEEEAKHYEETYSFEDQAKRIEDVIILQKVLSETMLDQEMAQSRIRSVSHNPKENNITEVKLIVTTDLKELEMTVKKHEDETLFQGSVKHLEREVTSVINSILEIRQSKEEKEELNRIIKSTCDRVDNFASYYGILDYNLQYIESVGAKYSGYAFNNELFEKLVLVANHVKKTVGFSSNGTVGALKMNRYIVAGLMANYEKESDGIDTDEMLDCLVSACNSVSDWDLLDVEYVTPLNFYVYSTDRELPSDMYRALGEAFLFDKEVHGHESILSGWDRSPYDLDSFFNFKCFGEETLSNMEGAVLFSFEEAVYLIINCE